MSGFVMPIIEGMRVLREFQEKQKQEQAEQEQKQQDLQQILISQFLERGNQ